MWAVARSASRSETCVEIGATRLSNGPDRFLRFHDFGIRAATCREFPKGTGTQGLRQYVF